MGTVATEPLGLVVGVVAVGFLADALRAQSFSSALLGVACMTAALNVRAGAMLIPPALALWAFLSFVKEKGIARTGLTTFLAFASPIALTLLLSHLYGDKNVDIGWNFSMSLCGMAKGTDWLGCYAEVNKLAIPFASKAYANALYAMAWEFFKADPWILLSGVGDGVVGYFSSAPWRMLHGYYGSIGFSPDTLLKLSCLLIPGAVVYFWRASGREWLFWTLVVTGFAASVGFVWSTDGWRTLMATHPLFAMLLVTGLRSGTASTAAPINARAATIALGGSACALLAAPALLHLFLASPPTDEYSGRAITGFVVIPDGAAAPDGPPYLSATEFAKVVAFARLEPEWGPFVSRALTSAPFAMFWTTRIGVPKRGSQIYIGPAGILSHPEINAWRFVFKPRTPGSLSPDFIEAAEGGGQKFLMP
jgi:hypothetical protein